MSCFCFCFLFGVGFYVLLFCTEVCGVFLLLLFCNPFLLLLLLLLLLVIFLKLYCITLNVHIIKLIVESHSALPVLFSVFCFLFSVTFAAVFSTAQKCVFKKEILNPEKMGSTNRYFN